MIYIKKQKYYLLHNIFLLFYSKTQVFSFDIVVKQQYIHTIDDSICDCYVPPTDECNK